MKIELKNHGGSMVLVIPREFIKYHKLKVGDWVDIDDAVKITKPKKEVEAEKDKEEE